MMKLIPRYGGRLALVALEPSVLFVPDGVPAEVEVVSKATEPLRFSPINGFDNIYGVALLLLLVWLNVVE